MWSLPSNNKRRQVCFLFEISCPFELSKNVSVFPLPKNDSSVKVSNIDMKLEFNFFLIIGCPGQLVRPSTNPGALKLTTGQTSSGLEVWNVWHLWDSTLRPIGGKPFDCYLMPTRPNPLGLKLEFILGNNSNLFDEIRFSVVSIKIIYHHCWRFRSTLPCFRMQIL